MILGCFGGFECMRDVDGCYWNSGGCVESNGEDWGSPVGLEVVLWILAAFFVLFAFRWFLVVCGFNILIFFYSYCFLDF